PLHGLHPLEVVLGVQAQPARRTRRPKQSVAALPRAKELGTDSCTPAQRPDPQQASLAHAITKQIVDNILTRLPCPATVPRRTESIQEVNNMKKLDLLAATLLIVGGLNWGLVAVAKFDLGAWIFGLSFGETKGASRVV